MSARAQPTAAHDRVQVDFFCVGGNKCGTTWLSEMLRQHPDLNVSSNKEPNFFTNNWEKGWDWYSRNWTERTGLKGEFSTGYLHDQRAAERIAEYYPDAKILVMLRTPLDRAVSHCRHEQRVHAQYATFLDWIVQCSTYSEKMRLLEQKFPAQNVKVLFFEQVTQAPEECLREVFEFLGTAPGFLPDGIKQVIGKGFEPRIRMLERLRRRTYHLFQAREMYSAIVFLKRTGIAGWLRRLNSTNEDLSGIRKALRPHLPGFISDINALRESPLIPRTDVLDRWLNDLRQAAR